MRPYHAGLRARTPDSPLTTESLRPCLPEAIYRIPVPERSDEEFARFWHTDIGSLARSRVVEELRLVKLRVALEPYPSSHRPWLRARL